MIAQSKLTFDKQYYSQYFSDWIKTRSRFRKYNLAIAILLIVAGIVLCTLFSNHLALGILNLGIGLLNLVDALTYRSRWTRKRLLAGGSNSGEFVFYDDRICIKSDSSEGYHMLSGFIECTFAPQGVFLFPQKELSFYIPWSSIEPADALPEVRALLKKVGKKSNSI